MYQSYLVIVFEKEKSQRIIDSIGDESERRERKGRRKNRGFVNVDQLGM